MHVIPDNPAKSTPIDEWTSMESDKSFFKSLELFIISQLLLQFFNFFILNSKTGKMRKKDFEQAIILEEKISLQLSLLLENQNSSVSAEQLSPGADAFLASFGTYRDLVNDECDSIEIWKRVLVTVQEISQLASSLYTAATGLPLSRSCSSVGERQSEVYISPTLPKRAETFGGFDERRNKAHILPTRDAVLSTLSPGYFSNRDQAKRDSNASEFDTHTLNVCATNSIKASTDTLNNLNNDLLKDSNYAALQVK